MKKKWFSLKVKDGFTMLELIMVIIIIGILATLAIPQYTSFMEKARASEAVNTIGAIKTAQSMYQLETGNYATALADLDIDAPTAGAITFWTYAVTGGGSGVDNYTVTATRTSKKAATGIATQTIVLDWDDSDGEDWTTSTHIGEPK